MPPESPQSDPRTYFAEERTFLAWIRTGIALMGFGFVVARFGLFLRELASIGTLPQFETSALSVPLGTALLVGGVLVNIFGFCASRAHRPRAQYRRAACHETFHLAIVVALGAGGRGIGDGCLLKQGVGYEMNTGEGIISKPSKYSVPETLHRLETILTAKGIKVFALVDHSGEAEKAGLKMPPTQLLIFGNPKGGTPVMLAAPTAAIDLPWKALAWQDANGQVWLSYNDAAYIQQPLRFERRRDEAAGGTGRGDRASARVALGGGAPNQSVNAILYFLETGYGADFILVSARRATGSNRSDHLGASHNRDRAFHYKHLGCDAGE